VIASPAVPPRDAPPTTSTLTPRAVLVGVGFALLALTAVATPRARRWEDVGPLFTTDSPPARDEGPAEHDRPPEAVAPNGRPSSGPPPAHRAAPPPDPPSPPTAAERSVFGALVVGARVADGTVVALEGLRDGFLRARVRLPAGAYEVIIARAEGTNARPPVTVGPYAVYPGQTPIPYPTLAASLRAAAASIVPDAALVPPGLRPLRVNEGPR